jgi:cysteate synthase
MLTASNQRVYAALGLFEESEGIDIDPASGVALATLAEAASSGLIDREAPILLNITGGGWKHQCRSSERVAVEPSLSIDGEDLYQERTVAHILDLF